MYQYTVFYDYEKEDGTWSYNNMYHTTFHGKGMHDFASRELEYYLGSFIKFRINKILCD